MYEDLIGTQIGVLNNEGKEYKTITIVKIKNDIFLGDDGEMYTENDLNFHYTLTPEYIMYKAVHDNVDNGIVFDADDFKLCVKQFMDEMTNFGYVAKKE